MPEDGHPTVTDHHIILNKTEDVLIDVQAVPDEESPLIAHVVRKQSNDPKDLKDNLSTPEISSTASLRPLTVRLFVPFFLYCLAQGAVAAPKVNVVLALFCIRSNDTRPPGGIGNADICKDSSTHAEMARFMVYANLVSGILCVFSSPRIGALSDRYGRKPLIAYSVIGILLGDIISLVAASFPTSVPVYAMLIEFVIGGLTGTFFTTLALVQSYAADCTTDIQRTKAFGILYALMYTGMGVGPALGAVWVRKVGQGLLSSLFLTAGTSHLLFVCYILFVIPESLPKRTNLGLNQDPASHHHHRHRRLDFYNILGPLKIFARGHTDLARRTIPMPMLALTDSLAFGVQVGLPVLLVLCAESRFAWKTAETSLFLSTINMTRAAVLGVVLPLAMRLAGRRRTRTGSNTHGDMETTTLAVTACLALEVAGQVGFAWSGSPVSFVAAGVVAAAASPVIPVAQALMSRCVPEERLGELFGAVGLLHSIARVVVPASMQLVYSVTIEGARSTVFWVLGGFFGVVLLAGLWCRPRVRVV